MKFTWINLSLVAEICSPAAVLRLVTPGGMFLPCHQNGEHYDDFTILPIFFLDNFNNENNFKCTCILVPGTTCLRRIFERAALSPSNRYICSINIFFRNNLNGDFNYLMNIMKMKDKGEYGNKHLKVGVWDLLEGKVGWSKDSERAYLI